MFAEKMSELCCLPFHKTKDQVREEEDRNRNDEKRWIAAAERKAREKYRHIRAQDFERLCIQQEELSTEQFRLSLLAAGRAQLVYHTFIH
jgi:hypothetical protein